MRPPTANVCRPVALGSQPVTILALEGCNRCNIHSPVSARYRPLGVPQLMTAKTIYPNIGPVVGIKLFKQDVVVVREGTPARRDPPPRGAILQWSKKSRQRLAFVASNTDVTFRTMITLTYPLEFPSNGKEVKRHLDAFLKWLRRETGGMSYLWFLEFQRRGAPHFHIIYDTPFPRKRVAQRDLRWRVSTTWYRIVGSNDPKHLQAGCRTERIRTEHGARNYCVKYAFKMKQKTVPEGYRDVGRLWGASRDVLPRCKRVVRCTEDDVRSILETWEYRPDADRTLYRVLYETAAMFSAYIGGPDGQG